jgi:hypothetical protein
MNGEPKSAALIGTDWVIQVPGAATVPLAGLAVAAPIVAVQKPNSEAIR